MFPSSKDKQVNKQVLSFIAILPQANHATNEEDRHKNSRLEVGDHRPSTIRMPPGAFPTVEDMQRDAAKKNFIKVNVVIKMFFLCSVLQHAMMVFSQSDVVRFYVDFFIFGIMKQCWETPRGTPPK